MNPQVITEWSPYSIVLYSAQRPPPLGTVDTDKKLEQLAREHLIKVASEGAFLYVFGSAGVSKTYEANRKAFDKWAIVPRMLRDCSSRNLETTIFGQKFKAPMLLAPIGVQGILHPEAELATAIAARETDIPMVLSTAATRSMEEVAQVSGDAHRWYQLYWPLSDEITLSLLKRAKESGYSALVVTLDTMFIGWRPHDIDTAYLPFVHSYGCQNGFSDPVFMARYGKQPATKTDLAFPYNPRESNARIAQGDPVAKGIAHMSMEWNKELASGRQRSWDELKLLRDNWEGKLVLKGIQSVADAESAIDAGADGIIVSNHGGRQVDGGVSALWSLEQIMKSEKVKEAQATGKLTILFDSSIRNGPDMFKALALGAQAVLLGRPYVYGLALGGADGVKHVIKSILAELEMTMGLSGYKSISEIQGKAEEILARVEERNVLCVKSDCVSRL
ncbi:oxidoreductase [Thelephora terrestris]|uniref:Oxidoreductase n=1 Tax=Thelephora terrestris TaxID=56493 RepID=A0A9P6L3C8_9AGAM|nr:oxidoreductase [Thelephora terrestris]